MDELMNGRLRDQELALQAVIGTFSRLRQRADSLGSGRSWVGPAGLAYDAGLNLLRMELQAAHSRLMEALDDTASATITTIAGESRGG